MTPSSDQKSLSVLLKIITNICDFNPSFVMQNLKNFSFLFKQRIFNDEFQYTQILFFKKLVIEIQKLSQKASLPKQQKSFSQIEPKSTQDQKNLEFIIRLLGGMFSQLSPSSKFLFFSLFLEHLEQIPDLMSFYLEQLLKVDEDLMNFMLFEYQQPLGECIDYGREVEEFETLKEQDPSLYFHLVTLLNFEEEERREWTYKKAAVLNASLVKHRTFFNKKLLVDLSK